MPTIKDVAKHTGLSLATISKYLNGGNVRTENRNAIEHAIEVLGYRVNRNARSLKTNRTMTIGVVMPTLSVPFFGSVLSTLDACVRQAGYTTFVCSYDFDRELELDKLRILANNNVDGIVLIAQNLDADDLQQYRTMAGESTPIVLVDRTIQGFVCDSVVIDNLNATYCAVEQLINGGHRRIGIIVGPLDISTAYERMVGYKRALADYGLATDSGSSAQNGILGSDAFVSGFEPPEENLVQIGSYDFESGYRLFNQFMDMEDPPTALCVTNYDMTMGAVTAAHERSIVLGRDIGFVGFDAIDLCRIVSPPLSIIEQPTELMGRRAGEILLARLSGDMQSYPQVVRLKSKLHSRTVEKGYHRSLQSTGNVIPTPLIPKI